MALTNTIRARHSQIWLLLPFGVALLLIVSAGVSAIVLGRVARTRLGGQTGDVLGASSQICECLALIVLVSATSR